MRICIFGAFGAAILVATPAMASDRTGYSQIASGDIAAAERTIDVERRIYPNRPELMLNLASVYRQTGRSAEAQALYRRVLAQPDVAMDLPNGQTASSRALAKAGLAWMTGQQLSAR